MSEDTADVPTTTTSPRRMALLWALLPIALMAAAFAWLLGSDLTASFRNGAPPVENIAFERTVLDQDGLRLLVRAGGSEPMTIAQVQVDAAYWQFQLDPPGPVSRGSATWVNIPFPWVLGEAHNVTLVTNTGATFAHNIAVAVPTPQQNSGTMMRQAVLGAFVGILPVVAGLMFFPALRGAGPRAMRFLLALTVGLLAFLLVDTLEEAFEFAAESAALFQGTGMVIFTAIGSFALLTAVSRREGSPSGIALATLIAIGIGLHNFGEGLAIGGAFAAGAAGLGTFLVMGFTLHNITEGIGIAAPILRERLSLARFATLALIAGGPAVVGIWVGSLATSPQWTALALAVGAGAILQVIIEVSLFAARGAPTLAGGLLRREMLGGVAAGLAVMYATAMLVKI
ncbi:MAG: metal transporter [Rhizobium sp.]|nr:metal transporter [Rhizobium sp.]